MNEDFIMTTFLMEHETEKIICVWVEREVLFAHVASLDSMKLIG
jgi:hypothetical protein